MPQSISLLIYNSGEEEKCPLLICLTIGSFVINYSLFDATNLLFMKLFIQHFIEIYIITFTDY